MVETARTELRNVATGTDGWKDKQREQFDKQRIKPLDEAASRLLTALRRANQQLIDAVKMQAD